MVTRVKICGVRTIEAARVIREAGAELAGINFVPASKRAVDPAGVSSLIAELHGVAIAGVFQDQPLEAILEHAASLDYVQLHGRESPEFCAAIDRPVIKALSPPFDPKALEAYAPHVALFLFDGAVAGSGRTFDWTLLAGLEIPRPFLIAGGLNPSNVRAAIAQIGPWGVDTASGVERAGAQDAGSIRAFVKEAKSA